MPLGGLVLKSRYNVQANVSENELSVGDCPDFYRSKTINRLEQDLSMDRHSNGRVFQPKEIYSIHGLYRFLSPKQKCSPLLWL